MMAENLERLQHAYSSSEWPTFAALTIDRELAELTLKIDESITWLEGHFPGQPILPGVVQTHWAMEFGCKLFDPDGEFRHIDNLKFHNVVLPGIQLTLSLHFLADKDAIRFSYRNQDTVYSEGKLCFGEKQ